ncbi:uncharacterized protein LOC128549899 isoform X2 [Mercenaria mercenaria]|nr:uncharacterized protein LOC128549899 isoform X2 [Mercenaria mercenaria]
MTTDVSKMESEESIVQNELYPASLSMSRTCAVDSKNTSPKNIASCQTVTQVNETVSVDARSASQAEIIEGSICKVSNSIPENNEFHEETYQTLCKDPLKVNSKSLVAETQTESKMKHISSGNDLSDRLNKTSDDIIPEMSRMSVTSPFLSPSSDSVNGIRHDENASNCKHEMYNKCSDELTKPMAIDMKGKVKPTQETVASSITTNVEPTAQRSESLESQIEPVNVCLNAKKGQERISVKEPTILSDDTPKTTRSASDLNETCTDGSKIIYSRVGMGIQSDNRSMHGNDVDAPNMHCIPKGAHRGRTQNMCRPSDELFQRLSLPTFRYSNISEHGWKPKAIEPLPVQRLPYNKLRRRKYVKTSLDSDKLDALVAFYDKKLQTDDDLEISSIDFVDEIIKQILDYTNVATGYKYSRLADDEGSVTVDANIGKLDELDYSVEIVLEDNDEILLSDEPFNIVYANDDIDANVMDEIPATMFVNGGKRLFPEELRPIDLEDDPVEVPDGHVAVWLGLTDASRFLECCTFKRTGEDNVWGWILPYQLLYHFHGVIGETIQNLELEGVSLNNGARGPAVTLTILQQDGPNISVDITPKLNIAAENLKVTDFHWPRFDTKRWLKKSKIKKVCAQTIYLVPKGDKYWKISFANLENELLDDIDDIGTWRKQCLRIMKKKLIQWKSKSRAGLKCLSSYLLKTTLLWLCEILPDDKFWTSNQLANRYLNFLQELEHRLEKKNMGEYFNPSVNLLEYKDDEDMEELRQFLLDEIEEFTK